MLEGVRHLCFDKDGTLTDVHTYWVHSSLLRADALCRRFGLPSVRADALLDAMGVDTATSRLKPAGPVGYQPRAVVLRSTLAFLASADVPVSLEQLEAVFAEVDAYQQSSQDYRIRLLPGVADALASLRGEGLRLSIYSSDRLENISRMLDATRLGGFFDALVGGGCVTRCKPDPEGFLTACTRAGVPVSESGYVGDTADDMRMSLKAGARTVIGVASGLDPIGELARHTPHAFETMAALGRRKAA